HAGHRSPDRHARPVLAGDVLPGVRRVGPLSGVGPRRHRAGRPEDGHDVDTPERGRDHVSGPDVLLQPAPGVAAADRDRPRALPAWARSGRRRGRRTGAPGTTTCPPGVVTAAAPELDWLLGALGPAPDPRIRYLSVPAGERPR